METPPTIRIAVVCLLVNAGETTRAVEIAKAIRRQVQNQDPGQPSVDIRFFSSLFCKQYPKMSYQRLVRDAGFEITFVGQGLKNNDEWQIIQGREHAGGAFFVPSEEESLIQTYLEMKQVLQEFRPAVVLHGFTHNADGPIVANILGIPNISFLPVPISIPFMKEVILTDVPEALNTFPISWLPYCLRRKLIPFLLFNPSIPSFQSQATVRAAAIKVGVKPAGRGLLADIVAAKLVLVNDLPGNFEEFNELPTNHLLTGAVFANSGEESEDLTVDPAILDIFSDTVPPTKKKVFIAMGSSGHKRDLVQAIAAVNSSNYHVVALVPPSLGTIDDIKKEVEALSSHPSLSPTVYLTDHFVPSVVINPMADVSIIHGGQGTVQTALASGTPIVGVAVTLDQEFNLVVVERRKAGLKLTKSNWTATNIAHAVEQVGSDSSFARAAKAAQDEIAQSDGARVSANAVLKFVRERHRAR